MKKQILLSFVVLFAANVHAQELVEGGQFKDRILPMRGNVTLSSLKENDPSAKIWGATGVQNRYVDNGTERDDMNIWGGNVYKDENGVYHQFVAGWDGNKYAFNYWSNSRIYHFTSDAADGPFTNPVEIGAGHNPEMYIAKDGTYVVYALIGNRAAWRHTAQSLNGPWTFEEMPSNTRDRALSTGSTTTYSNWTFAKRQDGSVYCMDRGGAVWISEDGLSEFGQMLGLSCYPNGGGRTFEDPVVWRDEVQYHMIVNDWNARKAYYSRSADGFHWVAEDGLAYDIDISVHPDGIKEEWYKYERPRIFQDKYGRAIQLNMAVIDTIKAEDKAGDNHSSKNIAMPLNHGLRLFVLNDTPISASTDVIKVKMMKEDGFNPSTDVDVQSLRFGKYSLVNKGGGAAVASSSTDEDGNLILCFNGLGTELDENDFAPKLIGRYAAEYINPTTPTSAPGAFCFGYAKLPYYNYTPAYLSPILPEIGEGSIPTKLSLYNAGLAPSEEGITVKITSPNGTILSIGAVGQIQPYGTAEVPLEGIAAIPKGTTTLIVSFFKNSEQTDSHELLLTAINALQSKLSSLYNEALTLYENDNFVNGREEMATEMKEAEASLASFYAPEINSAIEKLSAAILSFRNANPDVPNVSCKNYYLHPANISSGNTYMYVSEDGNLLRKGDYDDASVFTLVLDGDLDKAYLYNPSSKTFVVAKAGNNKSFWSASATQAYCLAGVEASATTSGAYVIKGDPTSTNIYNYMNAYGGGSHTEICSYTSEDKGSQWLLESSTNQTYVFDVTDITVGLDSFLETAKKINGVTIIPEKYTDSVMDCVSGQNKDDKIYNLMGLPVTTPTRGIYIQNGKKIVIR